MDAAVAQFAIVQVGFLRTLTGQLRHAGHRLAFLLALLYLAEHGLGGVGVLVQIVVHLGLDEVTHIFIDRDGHWVFGIDGGRHGCHRQRAELDLRLALKHRFLHVQGNSGDDASTDIDILKVFLEKLLDSLCDMLLEGALMGTALRGVLSVDKTVVFLAVLVGMGEGYLDVFALQVDDGIEGVGAHAVF